MGFTLNRDDCPSIELCEEGPVKWLGSGVLNRPPPGTGTKVDCPVFIKPVAGGYMC